MSSRRDLKSATRNSPLVMVPVLSNAMIFVFARVSKCCAPLNRTPSVAAFDKAQNMATGVERRSAHGHPLTRTTRAKWNHCFLSRTWNAKGTTAKEADITTIAATRKKCISLCPNPNSSSIHHKSFWSCPFCPHNLWTMQLWPKN